jgi:hypothetical protein
LAIDVFDGVSCGAALAGEAVKQVGLRPGVCEMMPWVKGKVQCLSSDKFYHEVLAVEEGRKMKAAGKERKELERARKKEKKLEIEREWAEMKCVHAELVEAWTAECWQL